MRAKLATLIHPHCACPTASAPLRRCNAPRDSASTATLSQLTAVSPIDGRYADKTVSLREYFSEFGLIKYRVQVEIAWLLRLAKERILPQLPPFDAASISLLQARPSAAQQALAPAPPSPLYPRPHACGPPRAVTAHQPRALRHARPRPRRHSGAPIALARRRRRLRRPSTPPAPRPIAVDRGQL